MKSLYLVVICVLLQQSAADLDKVFSWFGKFKEKLKIKPDTTTATPIKRETQPTQRSRAKMYTDEPLGTKAPMLPNTEDAIKNIQEGLKAEKLARVNLQKAIEELKKSLSEVEELKNLQVTKCESGIIPSPYCNPPSHSCFNGKRSARFRLKFTEPPAVTVGLVHLDLSTSANTRVSTAEDIHSQQFAPKVTKETVSVTFHCWNTSVCYMAAVSWMACGPVTV
ncbi:uncharacterized protein LOC135475890 [Liolophura sinensis]|uniref:uncharacterized protein LOC135475890 n=1 Tax=Liolophura sinensis TaxID=3198878 RepID=UPI003159572B